MNERVKDTHTHTEKETDNAISDTTSEEYILNIQCMVEEIDQVRAPHTKRTTRNFIHHFIFTMRSR